MAGRRGRKSNGEGSIRQRANGLWEARITLPGGNPKSFYAKKKEDALRKQRQAQHAIDRGLPVLSDERQTLDAFLTSWLEGIRPPQVRPKTYRTYEQLMRVHVIPSLGRVRLAKLAPQQLQALYAERLASGRSPTTVRHIHAVLHVALEQAVRWNLVARNVADLVDAPRMRRTEMLVLNAEQARAFLAVAQGDRLEALYVAALTTGMREGELLALRWRDVDLDAGHVQVRNTLQKLPGQPPVIAPAKTNYSHRKITLSTTALEALRAHRVRQNAERLAMGPVWEDWELVFCTTIGTPLSGKNLLERGLRPLLKRATLPPLRFHDLRHTCATLLLLQEVHPKIVSEMLGHSSVAITLQVYSHVLPDMQKQARAAMDRLVR
ncbi:MAG TPA: site-specific integrase [Ktedonobacterales bacterium]|nr:site-specific integrase [Ktedonobacterales bacterium]